MQSTIKRQIEKVILLREHLAQVEAKRSQYPHNTPPEIFRELMDVINQLEQAEGQVHQTSKLIMGNVNKIRGQILTTLNQYNLLREKMSQIEDLFLVNIIRPSNTLRQAIHQREYLEQEFKRIQSAIEREKYASQQDLEADIRYVLTSGDAMVKTTMEEEEDPPEKEKAFKRFDDIDVNDILDAISIEKPIAEFKRIVLPAVHPDTSETPDDVFKAVYGVYEKKDILLMETYLVEYRGEVKPDLDSDSLNNLEEILRTEKYYKHILEQLKWRLTRLQQDLTSQEVKNPEDVQTKMQKHRLEILKRIQTEAEQINYWREKIEDLL